MRVSVLEGHRLWASSYDTSINPLLALEDRVLPGLLPPAAANLFIDVACGTGRWMTYLRQRGAAVFGVDFCPEMIAEANKKQLLRNRVVLGDAATVPFANGIADISLCSFAAGYFCDLHSTMCEIARVTSGGGKVILSDLHPARLRDGWTRSFRLGDSVYEMEHADSSIDEFLRAAACAGLRVQATLEVCFGPEERALFQMAGKEHLFEQFRRIPALWIGIWIKS